MQKFLLIFLICNTTLAFTGCKETLEQIGVTGQNETSVDPLYVQKLKLDLQNFDRIRTNQNEFFIQLNEKLKKAAHKTTSTVELRKSLQDMATTLRYQNEQFKLRSLNTSEVANLRNKVMQLNYESLKILEVLENPATVENRLNEYLNKQKNLLHEYNKLRTEIEAML